jgi:hypothetical protein
VLHHRQNPLDFTSASVLKDAIQGAVQCERGRRGESLFVVSCVFKYLGYMFLSLTERLDFVRKQATVNRNVKLGTYN